MTSPLKKRPGLATSVLASLVLIGSLIAAQALAGPGLGTLYGTNASGGELIRVRLSDGVGELVGAMGAGVVPALAVDPCTGTMYAGQGGGLPSLYTVDRTTGAATLVGDSGLGFAAIGALDFRPAKSHRRPCTLYASVNIVGDGGTGSDHLATIDTSTGVATVIGPYGTCAGGSCTIEGMEAIAFGDRDTLIGAVTARSAAGAPGLYRINIRTGRARFLTALADVVTGLPPSGGLASLQFDCCGNLWGGTARAIGGGEGGGDPGDGGRLVLIKPKTGKFRYVGTDSATGGPSLGALAFDAGCPRKACKDDDHKDDHDDHDCDHDHDKGHDHDHDKKHDKDH